MTDYKEKIKKLLSLASSDNQNEAKAALLKAKEMMAEHKLTEEDLEELRSKKVVRKVTDIEFTMQSEPWLPKLADVIAENYCCDWVRNRKWNARKGAVAIIGFEDDAEVCETVLKYAIDCVRTHVKKLKKRLKNEGYSPASVRGMAISYGDGFSEGVDIFYHEQQEKHQEWGLVLVKPKEVSDFTKSLVTKSFKVTTNVVRSRACYEDGVEDGKNFDVNRKVEEQRSSAVAFIA